MKERWESATPFFQKERNGSATPFFNKERERSGTLKNQERLTHCSEGRYFGRSVNAIPTKGADYAHHISSSPPGFENIMASLNHLSGGRRLQ